MILKKDEIQRQILIYLIEDEAVSQKQKPVPKSNALQSVEKHDNGCQSIEGRLSISATAAVAAINSIHNPNVSITKSLNDESCNSVNSLTFTQQTKKRSDDLQVDSPNQSKEIGEENLDGDVKPIKVVNIDTIKYSLQLIGFKYKDAHQFGEILKDNYRETLSSQVNQQQGLQDAFGKFKMARAYIQSSQLHRGIVEFATSNNYIKPHKENAANKLIQYFDMCVQILQKKYPLIILLGGTSGTGKSTLSSILASRFQIPTVLSTDSIRHIIRNFMDESEEPILFTSTYEAGKILKDDTITKESKKTIQGYKIQCKLVQQKLEKVIEQYAKKNEPMIIEGVHLTPRFMFSMMKKYPYVIPFTICIEKESKHRQRFAVRSKYMTLDKKKNKYIQYISNIRMIQAWFMEKSDEHLIPKINNVNIDKSVNIIHRVVTTYMRKMINYSLSVIPDKSVNALILYKSFNKVIKPLINKFSVSQEVNKNLVMQKFLDNFEKEENENNNNNINNNNNDNNNNNGTNNTNNTNNTINKANSNISSNQLEFPINIQTNQQIVHHLSMDNKIGNIPPIQKVSSPNYSIEAFVINRNSSPSVDLLNGESVLNFQSGNTLSANQIQIREQLQLSSKKSVNVQEILNSPSPQLTSTNSQTNKDPNVLLNQFLNDLENKHSKSFVEYTIKKIEDIKQTALKEHQQNVPPLSQMPLINQIKIQSLVNDETLLSDFKNGQQNQASLMNNSNSIQFNATNQKVNQIQNQQSPNILPQIQSIQLDTNTQNLQEGVSDFNQKYPNLQNLNQSEQNPQKIEIKLNGHFVVDNQENVNLSSTQENSDKPNEIQNQSSEKGSDKKITFGIIKPIKRKKKLKVDEKSNQVTIHSSHNEEQVNNEQQSEGDSLRMGEDNYQFDVLSEGVEEDEDLRNPEEHSNSIDDEEEDGYNDNFGNQSDESSDLDEERKDYQQMNEEEEEEEEYYEDDEEGEEQNNEGEEEDYEEGMKPKHFYYKLGDVVHELDAQQLKSLNYEGYQNYIKAISEIVEATVEQQKQSELTLQKVHLTTYKSQQSLQRKEFQYSKSQIFHSEEEGKTSDKMELHKKTRQRFAKHDRQLSFNKKNENNTPVHGGQAVSMTSSLCIFTKKRAYKSRVSRKNILSQNLIIQKTENIEVKEESSPIPIDNRAKSCDPDKSNLSEKNFKKRQNHNNEGGHSYFKDQIIQQIQQETESKVENEKIRDDIKQKNLILSQQQYLQNQ